MSEFKIIIWVLLHLKSLVTELTYCGVDKKEYSILEQEGVIQPAYS